MDLTLLIICALFGILIVKIIATLGASKSVPGPTFRFPILGHLPLLGKEPWIKFIEWKKIYGPFFAVKMGVYDVIVLNESKLIKEAFSRPEFSGRPPFELFQSASQGKGIGLSDGPMVAEQRNSAIKSLRGLGLQTNSLEETIRLELNQVLENIDRKSGRPVDVQKIFAVPLMNAIWSIFMGHRFHLDDPQLHRISQDIAAFVTDDGPLSALSMFVPAISKFMPELSGLNKKIQVFVDAQNIIKEALDESLRSPRTVGVPPKNFKEAFMYEMERVGDNLASSFHPAHNFFVYSAADIFAASMETTSTTLDWLLLYMGKYAGVQRKVQAEIDEKIGITKQPELSDRGKTPYVEAVIQELLRFSSAVPLLLIHRATEDAELRGCRIKKDTLLIGNNYAVNYDEHVWGDPQSFRPERFIDDRGTLDRNLMKFMVPFSTGKRSCIGKRLALDQIYLFCTSIFQRFHVSCGEEVTCENTVGIIRAPKPFQVTFTKRFAD